MLRTECACASKGRPRLVGLPVAAIGHREFEQGIDSGGQNCRALQDRDTFLQTAQLQQNHAQIEENDHLVGLALGRFDIIFCRSLIVFLVGEHRPQMEVRIGRAKADLGRAQPGLFSALTVAQPRQRLTAAKKHLI